jgi:hypothetical protein
MYAREKLKIRGSCTLFGHTAVCIQHANADLCYKFVVSREHCFTRKSIDANSSDAQSLESGRILLLGHTRETTETAQAH